MVEVNAHLHTPYSFSAFSTLEQALDMAAQEGVKVVGINDFYSMDGYLQWQRGCAERNLYPLFGIEFIALNAQDQAAGLRVNDPNNPGRTYISGKGLACPPRLPDQYARLLAEVRTHSNTQVERMCAKLNAWLAGQGSGIVLDFEQIKAELSCGLVRERHLAKALRMALEKQPLPAGVKELLPAFEQMQDPARMENTLRSTFLKAGGVAFVPEDSRAFLPTEIVQETIEAAGGIPTYPFLGDDAKGQFTDFERDLQQAADILKRRGFRSVEFITTRNTTAVLEAYALYLQDEGFIVSFGSEHNTPALEPIRLRTRDADHLSARLQAINYRGACAIAAHQAGLDSVDAGDELIQKSL